MSTNIWQISTNEKKKPPGFIVSAICGFMQMADTPGGTGFFAAFFPFPLSFQVPNVYNKENPLFFMEANSMRLVVKIGTSTLTHATGHLNIRRVESLCRVISDIKNAGHEVILVSSGAIGMGVGKLGLRQRPKDIPTKQAAAAVGQCELMYTYDKLFSDYHHTVAQLLITGEDVASQKRHANFRNTLNRLLELGALPILNENDTVATEEIVIGDNDTLAAIVARSVGADLLVLLSDIDGLYTADPRKDPDARLISVVPVLDDSIKALAGVSGSDQGTGGMITKLQAAEICMDCGCDMVIANGNEPNHLYTILDGDAVGTRFLAKKEANV